ncbi:cyanophycinase [Roseateles oligotrophus]|uniref:Cyanophycinase n=1 Tax=Roseateles oligotrophus TaxID=1769250 RepID=A0ABT2YJ98_9BURK|nr:cyanophycinase [Roseateles oligotrophus]MCV2370077.1 cyanophycinase [Roseateles oligotrophus]
MNIYKSPRALLGLSRGLLTLCFAFGALLSAPAYAGGGAGKGGAAPTIASKSYDLYRTGSAEDALPAAPAASMLVLMGGGTDVDDAFRAMIAKARGNGSAKVDVVIIRVSGADGYNESLYAMDGVDSVESLVIKTREGANDPAVNKIVAAADVLFIAGGDQWDYINLWKGSQLDTTLRGLAAKRVPIGGTSAGLAVLGQFDYSAQNGTVTSTEAMANPYDRKLTLDGGFLNALPYMAGVITDSHLVSRDRMGRLVSFLARLIKDGSVGFEQARGIGVDEQTAVVVDGGIATVMGNDDGAGGRTGRAYFLKPTIAPLIVKAKTALTFRSVGVEKRVVGGVYDLRTWPVVSPSYLSVEAGQLAPSPY